MGGVRRNGPSPDLPNICDHCGIIFYKKLNSRGRYESDATFLKRKMCSPRCVQLMACKLGGQPRKHGPSPHLSNTCEYCGKVYHKKPNARGQYEPDAIFLKRKVCSHLCMVRRPRPSCQLHGPSSHLSKTCEYCGEEFYKKRKARGQYPTDAAFLIKKYCSRKCQHKARVKKPEDKIRPVHICDYCGVEFRGYRQGVKKYCSKKCMGAAKIVSCESKTCSVCGAAFNRTRYGSGNLESVVFYNTRTCCSKLCGVVQLIRNNRYSGSQDGVPLGMYHCHSCNTDKGRDQFYRQKTSAGTIAMLQPCLDCSKKVKARYTKEHWRTLTMKRLRDGLAKETGVIPEDIPQDIIELFVARVLMRKEIRSQEEGVRHE